MPTLEAVQADTCEACASVNEERRFPAIGSLQTTQVTSPQILALHRKMEARDSRQWAQTTPSAHYFMLQDNCQVDSLQP